MRYSLLPAGFSVSPGCCEAAVEAAEDAKRKAGIFGDGSLDGDVPVSCERRQHGDHFGHGEMLADAASGTEPERD